MRLLILVVIFLGLINIDHKLSRLNQTLDQIHIEMVKAGTLKRGNSQ